MSDRIDRVLVADRDFQTGEALIETFKQYASIEVTSAPLGTSALDRLKDLEPRLVLLDMAFGGNPESGYELCRRIKEMRSDATRVILLTHRGEAFDRAKASAAGADAHLEVPWADSAAAKQLLSHHLFVRGTLVSKESLTIGTQMILDLLQRRITAVLEDELVDTISTDETSELRRSAANAERADSWIRAHFQRLIHDSGFAFRLAQRAVDEVPGILWTELKEQVICDALSDINDVGTFRQSFEAGQRSVDFRASALLEERQLPEIDYRVSSPAIVAAMRTCQSVLRPFLADLMAYGEAPAAFLGQALPSFMEEVGKQPETRLAIPGAERRALLGFESQALACAAFYTYLCGTAQALGTSKLLNIETVGTFEIRNAGVWFRPSPHFLNLIEANPLFRTASA